MIRGGSYGLSSHLDSLGLLTAIGILGLVLGLGVRSTIARARVAR